MRHIMFDIESTDVESTAAVLSIAMIEFKLDEVPVYSDLLKRATFVKFHVEEQIRKYKRTINRETMEWWAKRSKIVRDVSLTPKQTDLSVLLGLDILRSSAGLHREAIKNKDLRMWARGGLDQVVFEGLCRAVGEQPFIHYSSWRDVRTAVELLAPESVDGYCIVPRLNQDQVHKHDPVADCAYDICQLLVNNIKEVEVNE